MRVSKAAQRTGPVFSRRPPRPGETPRKSRLPAELTSPLHVSPRITVYIKTVGMDPADHGISRELERVDLYKGKVDKALKLGGPNTKLDVPAAERMINAAQGGKKKREANKDEAEDMIEEASENKKKGDKKKKKK